MQFGIDKFLEMFEHRFGRWLTTILLLLIALGISPLMVNLVVQNAVKPIADGVDKLTEGKGIDWRAVILQALTTLGLGVIGLVLSWTFATWLQRRWKRETDSMVQKELEILRLADGRLEEEREMLQEMQKALDEIQGKLHAGDEPETPSKRE